VSFLLDATLRLVPGFEPKSTFLTFVKPLPVIVTFWPPAVDPEAGVIFAIFGLDAASAGAEVAESVAKGKAIASMQATSHRIRPRVLDRLNPARSALTIAFPLGSPKLRVLPQRPKTIAKYQRQVVRNMPQGASSSRARTLAADGIGPARVSGNAGAVHLDGQSRVATDPSSLTT
jgi:hypothetical protein